MTKEINPGQPPIGEFDEAEAARWLAGFIPPAHDPHALAPNDYQDLLEEKKTEESEKNFQQAVEACVDTIMLRSLLEDRRAEAEEGLRLEGKSEELSLLLKTFKTEKISHKNIVGIINSLSENLGVDAKKLGEIFDLYVFQQIEQYIRVDDPDNNKRVSYLLSLISDETVRNKIIELIGFQEPAVEIPTQSAPPPRRAILPPRAPQETDEQRVLREAEYKRSKLVHLIASLAAERDHLIRLEGLRSKAIDANEKAYQDLLDQTTIKLRQRLFSNQISSLKKRREHAKQLNDEQRIEDAERLKEEYDSPIFEQKKVIAELEAQIAELEKVVNSTGVVSANDISERKNPGEGPYTP